ncbi:DNA replication licensing factor mcm8 [Dinochytrium kinnereticum]|nr:DNA replication licensing factor mcm8 [Dinochytrium kinnereticum]
MTDDFVDSVVPGDVVCVSGIVQALPVEEGKNKSKGTAMYSLYINVSSLLKASNGEPTQEDGKKKGEREEEEEEEEEEDDVSPLAKDFVQFSRKDLNGIKKIFEEREVFRLLVNSLCPTIFGHEVVKAGILLALFGGRNRNSEDSKSLSIRSNPHILIVGDPGLGKSQMLSSTTKVAPRGVYVCGNTATTSGLTVTLCKDGETGDTALEAGALVLGDKGVCCIDEFDKITEHHALLEAMEQQSISIAKAGIVCNLPARASVIAAANPVGGHYNKGKTVSENLKMNTALLSRFDLIFILLDKPNQNMDMFLSEHIVKLHSNRGKMVESKKVFLHDDGGGDDDSFVDRLRLRAGEELDPLPHSMLRKYIAYARKFVDPVLTPEAATTLQTFYLDLRK